MKIRVPVAKVNGSLAEYRAVVGDEVVEEILRLAEPLRGARVLHLSYLSIGTATSELLSTLAPLMSGAGLTVEWQAIRGTPEQKAAVTGMYEALGGSFVSWTPQMRERWLEYSELYVEALNGDYDFVVVHDPQPAGILSSQIRRRGKRTSEKWIWHCHLDLRDAQPEVWDSLRPHLETCDAVVYSAEDYIRRDLNVPYTAVIPPAVDPLSPRNVELGDDVVQGVLRAHGLDSSRPLLVQVGRLDRWSDPLGTLEIYHLAKTQAPDLQLLLVAMMKERDYQAQARYERVTRSASFDADVHLLSSLNNLGHTEINAFQRAGQVILQTGLRKGYDLHVLESLWKGRPLVADQVRMGLTAERVMGLFGATVEKCAENVLHLLTHPRQAESMGRAAQAWVGEHYLITRHLRDYLSLLGRLVADKPVDYQGDSDTGRSHVLT